MIKHSLKVIFLLSSINIAYPQSVLFEMGGAFKIHHQGEAPANHGTIRWNGFDHEVWNGTKWVSLTNGTEFTPYAQTVGSSGNEHGSCIQADHQGDLIVGGTFTSDTLVFSNDTFFRDSNADIFLIKFKADGQHVWSLHIDGDGNEKLQSIQVDDQDNIYISGYFTGNSISIQNQLMVRSNTLNLFFAKLDPNGNVVWLNGSQGNARTIAITLQPDNESNLILLGRFQDDDLVLDNDTVEHSGIVDVFIAKYDSMGQLLWVKGLIGEGNDIPASCDVDANNNIYLTGYYVSDTLRYENEAVTNNGSNDLFMLKLDKNGLPIWFKSYGGDENDFYTDISVGCLNELYVTGYFYSDSLEFDDKIIQNTGKLDFLFAKFDQDGNPIWVKNGVCLENDYAISVDINKSNEVFIGGFYYDSSLSIGNETLLNQGDADFFVAKYTSTGQFLDAFGVGDSHDDRLQKLTIDELGNVFGVGFFSSNSISFQQETFINQGGFDLFFMKYY